MEWDDKSSLYIYIYMKRQYLNNPIIYIMLNRKF